MHCKSMIVAALAVALSTGFAMGEDLTDEEILSRFLIQRDAFLAVKSGKGATRGLKIVTVEEVVEAPVEAAAVAVVEGTEVVSTEVASTEVEEAPEVTPAEEAAAVVVVEATPEEQPAETKVELAAAEVGLLPEELQVNVRISFEFDSALIPANQMPVIEQMCRVIKASDIALFRIMGHTDSSGTDLYNEELSRSRAEEVKRRMVADCGIDAARLDVMGLGERFLADPADPKGADNRRVEFQALS